MTKRRNPVSILSQSYLHPVSILGSSCPAKPQENRQKSRDLNAREKSIRAPTAAPEENANYHLLTLMSDDGTPTKVARSDAGSEE
jgi:hypothetical protein